MTRSAALIVCILLQSLAGWSHAAEPLGRLFFTPAQRAQLDTARSQKSRAMLPSDTEAAPLPETITYSGMVRRNDGKSTVWLNNRAINDRQPMEGVPAVGRVRPDGRIILEPPQGGAKTELKVGQSLEIVSGTIEEPYARRATAPKAETKPKPANGQGAEAPAPANRSGERGTVTPPAGSAPAPDTGSSGSIRKGG